MRLLRLEFEAIGPFPGRHAIDLESLGGNGLFLLEGPTGAGKTTIIDAIVFALFGDVSGSESSKDRLVSTHRPPTAEPFVELTFETANGLYRVRRTPQFTRAKRRGSGVATEKATCRFYVLDALDAEPRLVSGNIQEANVALREAVGLTKAQFTQTVVLPQGQFADFLRAKPEDRRKLLQDIFGTQQFEAIQEELKALAAAHRDAVESAESALDAATQAFVALAWTTDEPQPLSEEPFVAVAAARLEELRVEASRREAKEARAQEAWRAADSALRSEQRRRELLAARERLRLEKEALDERQADVARRREELATARRAELVRAPLSAHRRAEAEAAAADAAWQRAYEAAGNHPLIAPLLRDEDPAAEDAALQGAVEQWRARAADLRPLQRLEAELPRRDAELHALEQSLVALDSRLAQRSAAISELRTNVAAADAGLQELAAVVERLPAAQAELYAANESLAAHREAAELEKQAAAADQRALADATAAAEAGRRFATVQQRWVDAAAGRLAATLEPECPCPVCGATEHPAPAEAGTGEVSAEALDDAAASLHEATDRAAASRALAEERRQRLAEASAGLRQSLAEAQAAAAAAQQAVTASQQAQRAAKALERKLRTARGALELDEAEAAHQIQERADAAAALAQRRASRDKDEAAMTVARGEAASIASVVDGLNLAATTAAGVTGAAATAHAARERANAALTELTEALAAQRFANLDAAAAAARSASDLRQLEHAITSYDAAVAGIVARLAAPELEGLDDTPLGDLEALEAAAAVAEEAQRGAVAARTASAQALRSASTAWERRVEREADLAQLDESSKPFVAMANLARGDNPRHLTLATYVLLRRFEEIVDRANERLAIMTGGRYELVRSDEREGREQRTGLGLAVIDHSSHDARRDPDTLSGGETFLASLALALGLAEAVTSEAGGIELQTLFIDEGFGSLDPETLELVMQQLGRLRAGGRAVGIISHVTELKQQIADRISVRPRPGGGSTLTTTLDAIASRA